MRKVGDIMGKISMQTIASKLNISKAAVSIGLSGKPGVSDEMRKEILATARELGYYGVKISSQPKSKILVMIPEYIRDDRYFYNDIYWAIESRAKQKGYNAIICIIENTVQEQNEMPSIYYDMNFLGAITVGVFKSNYIEFLRSKIDNIISVDHFYDNIIMNSVVTANIEGSYAITKYVINQGHSKIGYVGSIDATASIYERWCGYIKAMREAKLPVIDDFCVLASSPLNMLLSNPAELFEYIKDTKEFPTAYICGGDRIAMSLIEVLKQMGKSVPDDISVAGFDNIESATLIDPPLTTVNVQREKLGHVAVDKLIRMANKRPDCSKTSIYTDLVIRNSVKKVK